MKILIVLGLAVAFGVALAVVVMRIIYVVVGRATENAVNAAILNFGNEESRRELEERLKGVE